jgi:ornithine cyclodeaminase
VGGERVEDRGMTIVLDDAEVGRRLDAATAVDLMRRALVASHHGDLVGPPRVHAAGVAFTVGRMPGRWYGYRSYDVEVGGDQLVAVYGEPDGRLAGVAVGSLLGALRTGALGGAAADAMARADATTAGVVGAGRQAWTQLWAVAAVRRLTDVAVFGRTAERRDGFVDRARVELGVPARAVASVEEAVTGRDIVVLATSASTPVVRAEWIAPGTAVTTVGPKQVGRAEFGPDLPDRADLIVTDSPAQLDAYDPPALLAGSAAVPLGAVLAGERPGRVTAGQVTLYASVGLAGTEPFLLAHLAGLETG